MYIAVIIVAAGVAGFLYWASASIASGVYLKAKCKGDGSRRAVALTFDDGPHPDRTPQVLDILEKHGVKAAFFVKGELAQRHPTIVERIASEGHIVGNHSWSHSGWFPLYGREKMAAELARCNEAIRVATGQETSSFRPPFGVTNPTVGKAVRGTGLKTYGWSIRSLDTLGRPRQKVLERIMGRLHNGAIILLHDDREGSAELADRLLHDLKEKDYTVLRADEI